MISQAQQERLKSLINRHVKAVADEVYANEGLGNSTEKEALAKRLTAHKALKAYLKTITEPQHAHHP